MSLVVFEDRSCTRLWPVSLARPAFSISCGASRLIDRLRAIDIRFTAVVRPHLREVVAADHPWLAVVDHFDPTTIKQQRSLLFVNARLVPSVGAEKWLKDLRAMNELGLWRSGDAIAAALVPSERLVFGDGDLEDRLTRAGLPEHRTDTPLLDHAHDIVRHHLSIMQENLAEKVAGGGYREIADGVFAKPGVELGPLVATDTSQGSIVIEDEVAVEPFTFLKGPIHIDHHARVKSHAFLSGFLAIGHTVKVGGDLQASVFEPYSNKQHDGFLGHSYVGSWVNLGAGTSNSDLKNTYGPVNARYLNEKVPTGMQFCGTMFGDYARSAIHTAIYTGLSIGVGSFLYGNITAAVPSFVNYARTLGQVGGIPCEVLEKVQARMFARRGLLQRGCDTELLEAIYEMTANERRGLSSGDLPPVF
jgi:UDP-N-acetylglucosamine diphosphorylase / glucose-1-phosphate thymidylyltransferase / UDP-N-acetylgalactosamine diphosphorylase / glucosamine-1-phosphate N-acetyltransferase / galactosamine-1-phosphate N-acetyltransferase